jgi:hypothetical protein
MIDSTRPGRVAASGGRAEAGRATGQEATVACDARGDPRRAWRGGLHVCAPGGVCRPFGREIVGLEQTGVPSGSRSACGVASGGRLAGTPPQGARATMAGGRRCAAAPSPRAVPKIVRAPPRRAAHRAGLLSQDDTETARLRRIPAGGSAMRAEDSGSGAIGRRSFAGRPAPGHERPAAADRTTPRLRSTEMRGHRAHHAPRVASLSRAPGYAAIRNAGWSGAIRRSSSSGESGPTPPKNAPTSHFKRLR